MHQQDFNETGLGGLKRGQPDREGGTAVRKAARLTEPWRTAVVVDLNVGDVVSRIIVIADAVAAAATNDTLLGPELGRVDYFELGARVTRDRDQNDQINAARCAPKPVKEK